MYKEIYHVGNYGSKPSNSGFRGSDPSSDLEGGKNKLGGREISVAKALALQVE